MDKLKNKKAQKVRIGIALGGNGAKGFSHIGIFQTLEKHGITPDYVAGTGVGAVIGAAYCLGYPSGEIFKKAQTFKKKFSTFRNFNFSSESLIKDKIINKSIREIIGENTTFEDLTIPFVASAVDLESGREVVIKQGKLWEAARASSAIPFVFTPVFLKGKYLIDGGTLNSIPVDHIKEQNNVDIIIGVDLGGMTSKQYVSAMIWEKYYRKTKTFNVSPSFFTKWKINMNLWAHVFLRTIDIMRKVSEKEKIAEANPDILIKPELDTISLLEFEKYQEAIDKGAKATEKVMPELKKLIDQKKKQKPQDLIENNPKS